MEEIKLPFKFEGQNVFPCPILINNRSNLTATRKKLLVLMLRAMNGKLEDYKKTLKTFLNYVSPEDLALLIKYYDFTWTNSGDKKVPQFVLAETQSDAIVLMDSLQAIEEGLFNV